jgi:hypothetical protein
MAMNKTKDENDSYLKPGQKDENDSYVGRPKPIKPMPAKPGIDKKRALREALMKKSSPTPKPKSGLDNTWM